MPPSPEPYWCRVCGRGYVESPPMDICSQCFARRLYNAAFLTPKRTHKDAAYSRPQTIGN